MRLKISRWLAMTAVLAKASLAADVSPDVHSATVLETMDSGGYTYVKVDEGGSVFWAAAPAAEVAVGDRVSFTEQMKMVNFTSRTLNRTFDELMFVSGLSGGSGAPPSKPDALAPSGPMAKADGGYTIDEIIARKEELKGKTVKVRGKVVKVSRNVMTRNWVHLMDGTGARGDNRLVFTSRTDVVDVGSEVIAEGTLGTDRDFGYGYSYPVLIENSTFTE